MGEPHAHAKPWAWHPSSWRLGGSFPEQRMLTPAEELGLSGLSLASQVRKAFDKIPEPAHVELMHRIREEACKRHLIYLRNGELDTIGVFPCPITVLPDQLAYIHSVSQTILNALKRD